MQFLNAMNLLHAKLFVFSFFQLITSAQLNAQCAVNILNGGSTDSLSVYCGEVVTLQRDSSLQALLFNDFNNGTVGGGWQTTSNANLNNPCGPGSSGTTYLWFGNSSTAPRNLRTVPLNLACGAQVCFQLRFAIQGGSQPCEGPDQPNEGITFEYSSNGGTTWSTIFDFIPNVNGSFNSQSPGSGDYTAWASYCFTLPPAASVPNVELRWQQYASTASNNDHWGIDSVVVNTFCGGTNISNLWNTGDTGITMTTTNITSAQNYWVRRVIPAGPNNPTADTCFDSIVVVPTPLEVNFQIDTAIQCNGDSNGQVSALISGGSNQQTYNWSIGDTSSTITGLVAGNYVVSVLDSAGCSVVDSIQLTEPLTLSNSITPFNTTCSNSSNGSFQILSSGGTLLHTYYLDSVFVGVGFGQTFTSTNNYDTGTYYLLTEDDNDCIALDTFQIGYDEPAPVWNYGDTTYWCGLTGAPLVLGGNNPNSSYVWSTGATTQTITVGIQGQYSVTITSPSGCQTIGSTFVLPTGTPFPTNNLADSTLLCTGSQITLDAGNPGSTFLWSTGDTSQSISVSSSGNYSVSVTTADGCLDSFTTHVFEEVCAGIEDLSKNAIKVYPNPAKDLLNIALNSGELKSLKLYSMSGQLLLQKEGSSSNQLQISLAELASGVYLLDIELMDNSLFRHRVVHE